VCSVPGSCIITSQLPSPQAYIGVEQSLDMFQTCMCKCMWSETRCNNICVCVGCENLLISQSRTHPPHISPIIWACQKSEWSYLDNISTTGCTLFSMVVSEQHYWYAGRANNSFMTFGMGPGGQSQKVSQESLCVCTAMKGHRECLRIP